MEYKQLIVGSYILVHNYTRFKFEKKICLTVFSKVYNCYYNSTFYTNNLQYEISDKNQILQLRSEAAPRRNQYKNPLDNENILSLCHVFL